MIYLTDVDLSSTGDGIFPFSTPSDPSNAMNMRLPLSLPAGDIAEATSSCLGGIFDPMDGFDWVSAITVPIFRHHSEGKSMSGLAESFTGP